LLFVDTRWDGNHGIGRFARETTSRLGIPFEPLRGGGKPSAVLDAALPSRLRLRSSDLLYSPGYNCGPSRARQILTIHDLIHLDDGGQASLAKHTYYERLVKPIVKRAGLVLTVSETSRQRTMSWIQDPSVDVRVVGNGSSDAFTPVGTRNTYADPTFLYVGNLRSHKNVPVVLRALAQRPDYRLIMVVPDVDEARELVGLFGLVARVEIRSGLGDLDLAQLYRSVTATLVPSTLEGFGLPALETFLSGTPAIYWAGCESVAEISNGHGIAIAAAGDAEEWAAALDASLTGGTVPAEQWRSRYDWASVGDAVTRALSE
jgi:glycosyltransferase involved in cell wall biosynthesis